MVKHCICLHTLIPVRLNPAEAAEMVTQVVFGELFVVTESHSNWLYVTTVFDHYKGWIDAKLCSYLDEEAFMSMTLNKSYVFSDPFSFLTDKISNSLVPLVAGSQIPITHNPGEFSILNKAFKLNSDLRSIVMSGDSIVNLACQFLNAPYLWGGRTILGIDCSGLSQLVYKIAGIALLRDASQQATQGNIVNFVDEILPADLAFFDNSEGKIIHVGIIINKGSIIHASGSVRIDKFDHQGIFNADLNCYTHKLRVIKRLIAENN